MERLAFTDGEKIGVFDGEKVFYCESEYIRRYRDYLTNKSKRDEWKYTGEGAKFRGDGEQYFAHKNEKVYAYINGLQWQGDCVAYSFTVNETSGVYRKYVFEERAGDQKTITEDHILTSSDEEILSLHASGDLLAVTVNRGATASVGTLNAHTAELKTLTSGDVRDGNASFSSVNLSLLYFNSAGAGMDANGNYTGKYSPSAICTLDLNTMDITEVLRDAKKSFFKPKTDRDGTLYCIERPTKEKRAGNVFLDILLIPYRILQAIVMFVQMFVIMFTGKSLTSETSDGVNPAKGKKGNVRKIYIDGNTVDADKELKRNKKHKDKEYGFIPLSWKLVKVNGESREVIKSGVCDFDFSEDGGIYCTNGRHIFYLKDGKSKKIADTDMCLTLATPNPERKQTDDLFGI